ncbi:MAG: 50S ribosomal protein L21e [Thermoplasmata archaeon]|nr:MAG: 50S ribosomal protein L21e [Thermoplasmata archaeon]KAA0009145.1 MAG: 50S ribosomal protein L21e [Thermoplasmata archaeon]MCD6573314.1 50S ribosomal protein L21e [Thermoplasmata archaeon]RLB60981.1 MAG: 50S ribosomal protein L21e [Deltaproteobacteria bacterium]
MKRSRGFRSKSRSKLRKKYREGRMNLITKVMQDFKEGEKVTIVIDPSFHDGMPHPRFHGRTGSIEGMQGDAYIVKIKDGGKIKHIISSPVHLRRVT